MITAKTKLNMVIGHPLSHTQSPTLHNAIYQHIQVDAILLAFPHTKLSSLIQSIKTLAVELVAVTMPFKEKIIKYLDYCSPEVESLKAANTLIQRDNKLYGYNTDVDGVAYALRDINLNNKNILIIGAGGAARAAAFFLKNQQANLYWLNRTEKKAVNIAKFFGGEVIDNRLLSQLHIDIIINTTPLGMYPEIDSSPLNNDIFKSHQIVFDMIYNPLETRMLSQAKKQGAKIISGIDMFIGQGLRQIELWQNQSYTTQVDINQIKQKIQKIISQKG
jgi:shikimate dehydrogenase